MGAAPRRPLMACRVAAASCSRWLRQAAGGWGRPYACPCWGWPPGAVADAAGWDSGPGSERGDRSTIRRWGDPLHDVVGCSTCTAAHWGVQQMYRCQLCGQRFSETAGPPFGLKTPLRTVCIFYKVEPFQPQIGGPTKTEEPSPALTGASRDGSPYLTLTQTRPTHCSGADGA